MNLLYINKGIPSVFDSQVLSLLEYYKASLCFNNVSLLIGIRNEDEKLKLLQKFKGIDINIYFYKSFPNYPFYNYLQRKFLYKSIKGLDLKKTIIHIRGELLAWHLGKSNIRLLEKTLIDIRGASIEEIKEYSNLINFLKYLKYTNYVNAFKFLSQAKYISVVSHALKNYLLTKVTINPKKVMVNHCLASSVFRFDINARNNIRTEFGIREDEILIVFSSGGSANWQNEKALVHFSNLQVKILNLSKKNIDSSNVINRFVDYASIYKYLSASDIAIIWREKSLTNKVASPVKYSEYLSCGLPVISNKNIDLIEQYTLEYSTGLIINDLSDITIEKLLQLKSLNRISISEIGHELFNIRNIAKSYIELYNKIEI